MGDQRVRLRALPEGLRRERCPHGTVPPSRRREAWVAERSHPDSVGEPHPTNPPILQILL